MLSQFSSILSKGTSCGMLRLSILRFSQTTLGSKGCAEHSFVVYIVIYLQLQKYIPIILELQLYFIVAENVIYKLFAAIG